MSKIFIKVKCVFAIFIWLTLCNYTQAQQAKRPEKIEDVVIYPFIAKAFNCREHYDGELNYLFDALGSDCYASIDGRSYRTDGKTNEDYYIWGEPVLAPFDGEVIKVTVNQVVNTPRQLGKPPATTVIFRRSDGVEVAYAHLDQITVKIGDTVTVGQPVAVVSNNGMSTGPHVHIGARRGDYPLQIRWDLRAIGELRRKQTETKKPN